MNLRNVNHGKKGASVNMQLLINDTALLGVDENLNW